MSAADDLLLRARRRRMAAEALLRDAAFQDRHDKAVRIAFLEDQVKKLSRRVAAFEMASTHGDHHD